MLKCKQLNYNWRQVGKHQSDDGQEFDTYVVGCSGVKEILNMTPEPNGGVPEFYDVKFDDGKVVTVYNPNQAFYEES